MSPPLPPPLFVAPSKSLPQGTGGSQEPETLSLNVVKLHCDSASSCEQVVVVVPGGRESLGSTMSEIGFRGSLIPFHLYSLEGCGFAPRRQDKAQLGKRLVPFPDKTTRGQWSTLAGCLWPPHREPGRSAEASGAGETGLRALGSETSLWAAWPLLPVGEAQGVSQVIPGGENQNWKLDTPTWKRQRGMKRAAEGSESEPTFNEMFTTCQP